MSVYSAAVILFLVMDPFGNIPAFLSVLNSVDRKRRKRVILREMLIALFVLTVFLFAGKYILTGLQISEPALSISGGIILFIIALKMIFSIQFHWHNGGEDEEPLVVPLAMPLIAGPSAMAMVILFSTRYPEKIWLWFAALIAAWSMSCIILLMSDIIFKFFGSKFMKAIEKFMGMILTTFSVQMLLNGIKNFIQTLN
ncbi:MAG: NAAT family transporter [Spirochaetia bacterium]|nr:NAAT family transporter [Spirochaetia bacterium]